MSTVRVNPKIKEEVTPILEDLGISLSEAINMFLHQIKINNGIPFEIKRKQNTKINNISSSYVCEHGYLHDYNKMDVKDLEEEAKKNKSYNTASEMLKDILEEDE